MSTSHVQREYDSFFPTSAGHQQEAKSWSHKKYLDQILGSIRAISLWLQVAQQEDFEDKEKCSQLESDALKSFAAPRSTKRPTRYIKVIHTHDIFWYFSLQPP